MFFKYFILILIFFYPCVLFPQKMYNIIISCEDNPVEFPYVQIKNSGIFKYGNKNGQLKIEAISDNDTLKVECIGYVSKEIPLKDQSDNITIELEQSSELLSEVIISLNNNEKSKWKKINRKTKRSSETTYYGLVEGCNIMSSYKIDDEIKFNGIRFFIITNAIKQDINFNKKIKQSSELLSEVIISLNNNEKSKWKKINRKTKRSSETTYYGLVEGCNIMSSYKIDDEIKFNGIRFFIITNAIKQDINFNKKIR